MKFKKLLSLLMAAVMVMALIPSSVFAADSSNAELRKTAEWVNQTEGLAKITLTAKGTPITTTVGADVVMVLDASGSMADDLNEEKWVRFEKTMPLVVNGSRYNGYYVNGKLFTASGKSSEVFQVESDWRGNITGDQYWDLYPIDQTGWGYINYLTSTTKYTSGTTRWNVATNAVKALADEVIPDTSSSNQLGLVVFSSSGYNPNNVPCGLTNNSSNITSIIPDKPEGGTDYTSALQRAYNMLNARKDKSRPGYVVFLTDGEPGLKGNSGNDSYWNGVNQIKALKKLDGVTIYTVGFSLPEGAATARLKNYATSPEDYHNITDASELEGLLSDIGSTIVTDAANVSIYDSIDTEYFTIVKKSDGSNDFRYAKGSVHCKKDKDITWSLDSFSKSGDTLEIYIQLKDKYIDKDGKYPTNIEKSAYGTYSDAKGKKIKFEVSKKDSSDPVPKLDLKVVKQVAVKFNFVGSHKDKASFVDSAQADQLVKIGDKVTEPGVTVAPGYQITDWYEKADCTGSKFNFDTPVTENKTITLHARVEEDRSKTYSYQVEFYKNGVKSEEKTGSVWQGTPTVTLANAIALKTENYTNCTFQDAEVGLSSYTSDTQVINIQPDNKTVIKVNYTVKSVDLTFEKGEHGKFSNPADQNKASVKKATSYDVFFTDVPGIKEDLGWQQVGWYEKTDPAKNIVDFSTTTVTGSKTYEMKYEKNISAWKSVTFDRNDGTSTPHKVVNDILTGSSVSNSDWPIDPLRDGYVFKGWFTKDGANDDWGTSFTKTSQVKETSTVFAKWEKTVTDVPVRYYLGSISDDKELTFSTEQKITNVKIGNPVVSLINAPLKGKGTEATNKSPYYEISQSNATVYVNGTRLDKQTVSDEDVIQVVYPAKMGTFKVNKRISLADGQYLDVYNAVLEHGSILKYGSSKTELTIAEINKILSTNLKAGEKLKSVSIEYQTLNDNGIAEWQTPVTAILNSAKTEVASFAGLEQLSIHGGCETRLVIEYESPIKVDVEYHKQYGDKYVKVPNAGYVVGGATSYVYKDDILSIVENATSFNNINKVVPAGVAGYQVARVATNTAPSTAITDNTYKITQPTTFIVFLDAITANGGKIVNVDNLGAPLEGAKFVFNQTNLTADNSNKNEFPIAQNLVYGVEYTVKQTEAAPGYGKVADFKVKLKTDGTLDLMGTVSNVTVNGMTITVANGIDENQKFGYTVNRFIKDTNTPVPGLPALTDRSSLGTFTWTNAEKTATGYKLVTTPVQPTSLTITADATKNVANVYYEVDDRQMLNYKVTYWRDGEDTPFVTSENLTVLVADPWVAYENVPKVPTNNNVPDGYEFKGIEFAGTAFNPNGKIQIASLNDNNEIKVIYQKQAGMWFDVSFLAGDHGKLNTNQTKVEWPSVLKDTTIASLGGIPTVTAENNYEFIGWSTDNGATLIQNEDLPTTITQNATYTAQWTQIYNVQYFVYEKKSDADTTITAKFNSEAEAEAAVMAHITHNSAQYSPALLSNQSKISNVDLNKFAVSTTPDAKDRTETADAKFTDLIRNYKGTSALNEAYKSAPGYDIVPFRLVKEGNIVHVDCYLVKNAEAWTTITFKAGTHGKWEDGANADVVLDAIKGAAWLNYSTPVQPAPVPNETGWKLANEAQIWDRALPNAAYTIPDEGLTFTAVWTEDNAEVSFQIKGIMVNGTEEFFGVTKPVNQSIQKGKTATDTTAAAIEKIQPGYKFDGWYTDEDCALPFVFSTPITDTIPLYGKVVVNDEDWARVTFTTDGHGTLNGSTDDVVTDPILIGNTIGRVIPSANANAGYEFDAWYKVTEGESGIEEILETPAEDTEVLGNMTYLAKFSSLLNVSFIINKSKAAEGTISPVTISGIHKNAPWTDISVPTVVGKLRQNEYSHDYEFADWDATFPDTVTSNLTFTAQFDDVYTFAVEHADINNDAVPQYPNEATNFAKKKAGNTISSQANAPVRGYELTNISGFVGDDKLDVETTAQLIQALKDYGITLAEDGTLSGTMPEACIWIKYGYEKKAERTVKYETEGNVTGMPENITDRYEGDTITLSGAVPQRDGYDFGGWEVVDQVVAVTEGMFTMPDSDVVLKAIWTPNEEVWNFTVEHYLEGAETPFSTAQGSVLKSAPNIESVVLNAPKGYKFKEYQINGDPTELPIEIDEDGRTVSVVYEKYDLIVKHVYGDNTEYDTTQSKAVVENERVVVNAVNSGRYTILKSVTINGVAITPARSIPLIFSEVGGYEVVFVYGRKSSDSGDSGNSGNSSNNGSDFGEEVTILDEEVPLADGLNMTDHFAYIFGYTDGTVKPTNKISREEVAAIFYRLLSDDIRATMRSTTQDFPDVSSQRWSNTSIATLANGGVLSGYPGGEFMPSNAITRAEFAVIVSKFDNLSTTDTNQFSDIENHWAKDFINSAALKGWISGYPDGTFRPNEYITRAEAMTLINSVLNRKVSKEGLLENAKYWSDNSKDAWYYEAVMEATNSHDYTRETPDGAETWTAITPDKTWN